MFLCPKELVLHLCNLQASIWGGSGSGDRITSLLYCWEASWPKTLWRVSASVLKKKRNHGHFGGGGKVVGDGSTMSLYIVLLSVWQRWVRFFSCILHVFVASEASIKIQREEDMDGDKKAANLSPFNRKRSFREPEVALKYRIVFPQERWVDIIGNARQRRAALERVPLFSHMGIATQNPSGFSYGGLGPRRSPSLEDFHLIDMLSPSSHVNYWLTRFAQQKCDGLDTGCCQLCSRWGRKGCSESNGIPLWSHLHSTWTKAKSYHMISSSHTGYFVLCSCTLVDFLSKIKTSLQ